MSENVGFDRLLSEWLEYDGPQDVRAEVVDAAIASASRVEQRRSWRRFLPAGPGVRLPAFVGVPATALVLIGALLLALLVGALIIAGQRTQTLLKPGLIVYSDDGSLTIADADGSDPRPVEGARAFSNSPTWSPDGRSLAYWTAGDPDQPVDLVVTDADGRDPRVIARSMSYPTQPSWAPDSTAITFAATDPTSPIGGVNAAFIVNASTGRTTRIIVNGVTPWNPRWSPRGDLIAFWAEGYDRETGIYVAKPDGTGARMATNAPCVDSPFCLWSIDWSPDGARVAYSTGDRRHDIWIVNVDTGNRYALTQTPANEFNAAWSPDGSRIAFVRSDVPFGSIDPPDGRVVIANIDDSDERVVTGAARIDYGTPQWSVDASSIIAPVYNPTTDRSDRLGVFPVDGIGEPTYLPLRGSPMGDASWQRHP